MLTRMNLMLWPAAGHLGSGLTNNDMNRSPWDKLMMMGQSQIALVRFNADISQ
jgi:hypothetical protein